MGLCFERWISVYFYIRPRTFINVLSALWVTHFICFLTLRRTRLSITIKSSINFERESTMTDWVQIDVTSLFRFLSRNLGQSARKFFNYSQVSFCTNFIAEKKKQVSYHFQNLGFHWALERQNLSHRLRIASSQFLKSCVSQIEVT